MWKKTKVFSKSSPLLNTLLLVLRCLAELASDRPPQSSPHPQ
jgi:hypothetical protein